MTYGSDFAAFIITYERASILKGTIDSLLSQTVPPRVILVIDNSNSFETQQLIDEINNPVVVYHRMGYNAGPAGAARFGLRQLAEQGYGWIYWGDDDNPPDFDDSFECLFRLIKKVDSPRLGIVGAVGQHFTRRKGEVQRIPDVSLEASEFLQVNSIAGGQCMIVNAGVVRADVLPNEKYFFGFEELDFCLKAQKAGFDMMVSSDLFLRARKKYGKMGYQRPLYSVRDKHSLSRQYYSTRNLIFLFKDHQLYIALIYHLIKSFIKAVYGFRFGWEYGSINFQMISLGIIDAVTNKSGKVK